MCVREDISRCGWVSVPQPMSHSRQRETTPVCYQTVSHLDLLPFSYVATESLILFTNLYMLLFGYQKAFYAPSCLLLFSHLQLLLIKFHLNIYYFK